MKTMPTGRLTLAAALLARGCRLAFPPYSVARDHAGRPLLTFNVEATESADPETLTAQALGGELEVNWSAYEQRRASLVGLTKQEK